MKNTFKLNLILTLLLIQSAFSIAQDENPIVQARRLTNFGVEAASKGLWAEAAFRWRQAVELFPGLPSAHNNLAVAYEHQGKYELAKRHYAIARENSRSNRYIESNSRMFYQFYYQHIRKGQTRQKNDKTQDKENDSSVNPAKNKTETSVEPLPKGNYHKVGSAEQVLIKHPKRETPLSGKYRRLYVAGFSPVPEDAENLNFETTEYLRSELRKYTVYNVIPLEELALPRDEDEFFELIDDAEFWRNLGIKVGADLIVSGRIDFTAEMSDGIYPYEYRDRYTGDYRTAQLMVQRTAFSVELDLFFHETATGDVVLEENFGQTIVYRGRLDLSLQAFFDVMNRLLPRFMDILVPREHDAIRFLLRG